MKFSIKLEAGDGIIPLGYRMNFVSLIKKAIEIESKEEFEKLYYYKDKKNKKIKPFTFSVYINDFKIEKDIINVNGYINLIISTPSYNLGIVIYNGLLKLKKHNNLVIQKLSLEKEKAVTNNKEKFKTLSPIYIKDNENKVLTPWDSNFTKEFNYITNLLLESYRGFGLQEELIFTPINMKKVVVKEKIKGFIEETKKEVIFITAYSGIFELQGNIEDLNLLKQLGVGFRRSEGFGLIDLM